MTSPSSSPASARPAVRTSDKGSRVKDSAVEGTAYWTCRNPDCRSWHGGPNCWPLRIVTSHEPYRTTKTAVCGRCGLTRPMTDEERKLVDGDEWADPPLPGTVGLIRRHASQVSNKTRIPFADVFSLAMTVAYHAALTFDPANGFQFSTYLTSMLKFDCSARKVLREARIRFTFHDLGERIDLSNVVDQGEEARQTLTAAEGSLSELLERAGIEERDRELLLLRFGHNVGLAELSERFSLPQSTLGQRIHKLLKRIRECRETGKRVPRDNSPREPHPKPLSLRSLFDHLEN
ncbi:MAG: sigma-70 family RNA polymerase sigma factor [Gemmataceae bacterium]